MKSIYELQQTANRLRQITEANSISPEDAFGLQSDVLKYLADIERNADGLGIRKVYGSVAAMQADSQNPIGGNGKALRFGQLVAIYDAEDKDQEGSGDVYAYQKGNGGSAWLLIGNIANIGALEQSLKEVINDKLKNSKLNLLYNITWVNKGIGGNNTRVRINSGAIPITENISVHLESSHDVFFRVYWSPNTNGTDYSQITTEHVSTLDFITPTSAKSIIIIGLADNETDDIDVAKGKYIRATINVKESLGTINENLININDSLEDAENTVVDLSKYRIGNTDKISWQNKNIAGNSSNIRLTSSLIRVKEGKDYCIEFYEQSYCATVFLFTDENHYTEYAVVEDGKKLCFTAQNGIIGFKISLRSTPDGGTVSSTLLENLYVYIINNLQNQYPTSINVASFNVNYYFSNEIYTNITDEERDLRVENFKIKMNEIASADILFTQEDIDHYRYKDNTAKSTYETLYKQMFPYRYLTSRGLPAIYSKYELFNRRVLTITTASYQRTHALADIYIKGHKVAVMSIHGGIANKDELITEFNSIINTLSSYNYVIIGGDTNAFYSNQDPSPEGYNDVIYDTFIANGYNTANFGYWGNFTTWVNDSTGEHRCIDTFLTKGILINSFHVVQNDMDDHRPIWSNLTIY